MACPKGKEEGLKDPEINNSEEIVVLLLGGNRHKNQWILNPQTQGSFYQMTKSHNFFKNRRKYKNHRNR